jgi:hypothetical protein
MILAFPRRRDLRVFALDLFDQQGDERAAFADIQIHDLAPRPMQVVGQEKNLFAQVFLV